MIIAFQYKTLIMPTLDITDNTTQVVVRFLPYEDEHMTIHLGNDGKSIIGTHRAENKEKSTWDELRVQIARNNGHPNPIQHGQYYNNRPLPKIDNDPGYYLGGRLIDLASFTPRQHYFNHIDQTILVPSSKFMLNVYVSTKDNFRDTTERTVTHLGDLCYKLEAK